MENKNKNLQTNTDGIPSVSKPDAPTQDSQLEKLPDASADNKDEIDTPDNDEWPSVNWP